MEVFLFLSSSNRRQICKLGRFTFRLAAGITILNVSHQHRDDNPTGMPSDSYTVQVTVTDNAIGGSENTSITVYNVAPVLSNVQATSPIAQWGSSTLSGNISDAGSKIASP